MAEKGKGYGGKSRKLTLLRTNLNWDTTYEAISDNVLFDRYNYMVYKVDTKNTSTGNSEVDYLEYFFRLFNTSDNGNQGITNQDLMQWKYDPVTGSIDKNTFGQVTRTPSLAADGDDEPAADNSMYIGKPNEGGVLIYNTTDWLQKDYDELDMRTFANIDSINTRAKSRPKNYVDAYDKDGKLIGKKIEYDTSHDGDYPIMDGKVDANGNPFKYPAVSIPYRTNGQSGLVNFNVYNDTDENGNAVKPEYSGGHLYPENRTPAEDTSGAADSHYSFLLASPYTTNINLKSGAVGNAYYVTLGAVTTISFGKLGVGKDYSWSKTNPSFESPFGVPESSMTGEKAVIDTWQPSASISARSPWRPAPPPTPSWAIPSATRSRTLPRKATCRSTVSRPSRLRPVPRSWTPCRTTSACTIWSC